MEVIIIIIAWQVVALASNIAAFYLCFKMFLDVYHVSSASTNPTTSSIQALSSDIRFSTSSIATRSRERVLIMFQKVRQVTRQRFTLIFQEWSRQRRLRFFTLLCCMSALLLHLVDYISVIMDYYLAGGVNLGLTATPWNLSNSITGQRCTSPFCTRSSPIVQLPSALYTFCVNCILALDVACVFDRFQRLAMIIPKSPQQLRLNIWQAVIWILCFLTTIANAIQIMGAAGGDDTVNTALLGPTVSLVLMM